VVISTFVVGFGVYYIFPLVGVHIPFLYCLVFGALISPTDPVAVLSILKQAKVSKSLETRLPENRYLTMVWLSLFSVVLQLAVGKEVDLGIENILFYYYMRPAVDCYSAFC
jgi:CPA1 family monovalent cation:H+ antiporter